MSLVESEKALNEIADARREKEREYMRKYFSSAKGKASRRSSQLKRNYGITLEQWQTIFEAQGSCCAVCKSHHSLSWDTDHCHKTGKVRGILCHACNKALGLFKDNIETLQTAINYLKSNSGE